MCFDSAAEQLSDENATYHKNRLCMSLSPLLTITESHGFRALVALVVWIVGRLARWGHEMRNLSCGNRQTARTDVSSRSWLRIVIRRFAFACREPVLWFDTMGRRAGPLTWVTRLRLELHDRGSFHRLALTLAEHASPCRGGSCRT